MKVYAANFVLKGILLTAGLSLIAAVILLVACRDGPRHFSGMTAERDSSPWRAFFDRFYFALITVTTTGYGDICPKSSLARTLTMALTLIASGALIGALLKILPLVR
jgi:hypothetical protein